MQLSEEWIDFLHMLDKKGAVPLYTFSIHFKNRKRAEKLLGEIIRQGLVDLDKNMINILITEKGRAFINKNSNC